MYKKLFIIIPSLVIVVLVGLSIAARPSIHLRYTNSSFASVATSGLVNSNVLVKASSNGKNIPLVLSSNNAIQPKSPISSRSNVTLRASSSTPSWISWLYGKQVTSSITITPPRASLKTLALHYTGNTTSVKFSRPVGSVRWTYRGFSKVTNLPKPLSTIAIPFTPQKTSIIKVQPRVYTWESFQSVTSVPIIVGNTNQTIVSHSPSNIITIFTPSQITKPTITIQKINKPISGAWSSIGSGVLQFTPAKNTIFPDQTVNITFTTPQVFPSGTSKVYSYTTPPPSTLRLQEYLSALGYLPFTYNGGKPPTSKQQFISSLYTSPKGSFAWRWTPPARLASMWAPGAYGPLTKGAIMNFENVNQLNPVGRSNPLFIPTLEQAYFAHHTDPHRYSWVSVSKSLPETLHLYENGSLVLSALVNTGIAVTPTANGSYPVYLRYQSQVMRGTNPNGTHYADLVKWVSYFNGGEAIHGFVRASYGFPQSLGCVELPFSTAAKVWPQIHIGTVVTIH